MINNYIWVTTSFEGFHSWEQAPDEVSFLRNIHRHSFNVKVYIEIFNNDRDIEFFIFKRYVNQFKGFENNASCETYSDLLYQYIVERFPNRNIIIEVSEDNENGSRKEYYK